MNGGSILCSQISSVMPLLALESPLLLSASISLVKLLTTRSTLLLTATHLLHLLTLTECCEGNLHHAEFELFLVKIKAFVGQNDLVQLFYVYFVG
ncbi:hypothetical protein Ccrd_020021 [Cynara cardunculus var. scolymus]|uniref:Uncharacterized protein n=1 Tax=Cynara cardunculus var. scolymus TaxID=59895 RepID=A0A103Y376_CYNCS|nr:hypothetical protein Ccrd_020021 [Cynara cardunculus var. scolymus]